MSAQQSLEYDKLIKQNEQTEIHLRLAENGLAHKEKIIDRYKTILSISIEDL